MIVVALVATIVAIVGSFWPVDNAAGVGCGSVLVSTTEAADRDAVLRDKAVQKLIANSGDSNGDAYQGTLLSPGDTNDGTASVLFGPGNVGLCKESRSTVRAYLYSGSAAALVCATVGWFWQRRRMPSTRS